MNKIIFAVFLILQLSISSVFADKPKLTEEEILKKYPQYIQKHDKYVKGKGESYHKGGYKLFLNDGKKEVILNNYYTPASDGRKVYTLYNYIPHLKYIIFGVSMHEWYSYNIFPIHSGEEFVLDGKPNFSSNKKHIITTFASEMESPEFNGITIYNATNQDLEKVKFINLYLPYFHSWINSHSARIVAEDYKRGSVNYILYYDKQKQDWLIKETKKRFSHKKDLYNQ